MPKIVQAMLDSKPRSLSSVVSHLLSLTHCPHGHSTVSFSSLCFVNVYGSTALAKYEFYASFFLFTIFFLTTLSVVPSRLSLPPAWLCLWSLVSALMSELQSRSARTATTLQSWGHHSVTPLTPSISTSLSHSIALSLSPIGLPSSRSPGSPLSPGRWCSVLMYKSSSTVQSLISDPHLSLPGELEW